MITVIVADESGAASIIHHFVAKNRQYDIDDMVLVVFVAGVGALWFSVRRWRDLRREVAARKLSEERFDRVQEIAGIGSWELDVPANRYNWSKQMYRLRGLTPDKFELTSSAVAAYVHPEDEPRARQFRDDLKAGMMREPIEIRVLHPNGESRLLRFDGGPVVDSDGAIRRVKGTAQDITEQRQLQLQLLHAQKMELIGTLAGGVAHDFNNVLGVVIGNLDLLRDHTIDNAEAEDLRRDTLSGALHGADLIRQLLAFARRQPLSPRNIDVNELIRSTSRLLERLLNERIEMRLELDPGVWPVSIDPVQLEAAIANLAANARDAMPRGGRLTIVTRNAPRGKHECAATNSGGCVLVEVSDTGCGIPAEIIGKVFDPFFTTKAQGEGSGLGLSMVQGFMEQSGGRVTVKTQRGAGTTFSLRLPRALELECDEVRTERLPDGHKPPGSLETVLVVEDNAPLRRVTVRQLVSLGYRVFEAADAESASLVIRTNNAVQLLFTDVVMPGRMDGIELVEWAHSQKPDLRCLLTSAFSDLSDDHHRLKNLRCKLISKPYRADKLAQAIRDVLDGPAQDR
jgi:PAS domain S-box-containing protein